VIASGVLNAAKNIGMKKPIIIRLKGTNVKEAKKLIAVRIVPCVDFSQPAGIEVRVCVSTCVCTSCM
jgi:succinyl-CoA synthetase beta subunit